MNYSHENVSSFSVQGKINSIKLQQACHNVYSEISNRLCIDFDLDSFIQFFCWSLKNNGFVKKLAVFSCDDKMTCISASEAGIGSSFYKSLLELKVLNQKFCLEYALKDGELKNVPSTECQCSECILQPDDSETIICKRLEFQGRLLGIMLGTIPIDFNNSDATKEKLIYIDQITSILAIKMFTVRQYKELRDFETQSGLFTDLDNHVDDAILILNGRTQIIYFNRGAETLLGYKKSEILSMKCGTVMLDPVPEDVFHKIRSSGIERQPVNGIASVKKQDNTRINCEFRMIPITFNKNNRLSSVLCIMKDATPNLIQQELQKTELVLNDIITGINDGVFSMNQDGYVSSVNPALENILKCQQELIVTKSFYDFVHPQDRERIVAEFQKSIQGNISMHEFRMIDFEGCDRYIQASTRPYSHDHSNTGLMGVITDITDRRLGEMKLKEMTELLETLIDNANVWIVLHDDDGRNVRIWNKTAQKESGFLKEDVSSFDKLMSCLFPDVAVREKVGFFIEQTLKMDGLIDNYETSVVCKNRNSLIISWNWTLLKNEKGQAVGIVGIGRNVTSEAEAKIKHRDSEEKYRALAENSPDIIIRFDHQGRIVYVNPIIKKYTHQEVEDCLGKTLVDLHFPSSDYSRTMSSVLSIFENCHPLETEYEHCTTESTTLNWRFLPEFNEKGEVESVLSVVRDVTSERTMERQILQFEKMQAIGQLAGGIAHDFNNQLSAIIGLADLLGHQLSHDPQLKYYTDMILKASERSADLTSQLLAFARKGKYRSVKLDVHVIIKEVIDLLRHSFSKHIQINEKLHAETPYVNGDPTQIQNAILNLAINARDAMPDGGELEFSTQIINLDTEFCHSKPYAIIPGDYLRISVKDNGIGISDQVKNHIFEPFFTTKSDRNGSGMGLAAVYGTVKNHKGSVDFVSEVGKGTEFRIYLPHDLSESTSEPRKAEVELERGSAHIMFVDDEDLVCQTMQEIISNLGHYLDNFNDGSTALNHYRQNWKLYDLVIVDIEMPGMNGFELFYEIKKINPNAVIVGCSGYSMDAKAHEMIRDGAFEFLTKPFRINCISNTIKSALKKKKSKSERS